jgi:hypothetical protein
MFHYLRLAAPHFGQDAGTEARSTLGSKPKA